MRIIPKTRTGQLQTAPYRNPLWGQFHKDVPTVLPIRIAPNQSLFFKVLHDVGERPRVRQSCFVMPFGFGVCGVPAWSSADSTWSSPLCHRCLPDAGKHRFPSPVAALRIILGMNSPWDKKIFNRQANHTSEHHTRANKNRRGGDRIRGRCCGNSPCWL